MRLRTLIGTLLAALVGTLLAAAQQRMSARIPPQAFHAGASYGELPLTFEANHGQANPEVKFLARGTGYTAVLTAGGMIVSLRPSEESVNEKRNNVATSNSRQSANSVLKFQLIGATQNPPVIGEGLRSGKVNYFIGNNPAKWQTNVPTYDKVRYKNIYPGIDLVYYGNHRQLEYDFAIAPGADPTQIQFEIQGANQIELDVAGNLVLHLGRRKLLFQSPVVYQESDGVRTPLSGAYVVKDATHIGFQVMHYDPSKPLVIDPVLVYSTYLGGTGDDQPSGIAVDHAGSVYVAGSTDSIDFPLATLGVLPAGAWHVFVAKLDATGSNLVYADYIGGNSEDYGYALALDSNNEVYVTGSTASSDFPLVNPYQPSYPGSFNGFLTKISADGSSLLYSTYIGGNGSDIPSGIAIDNLSHVFIAGNTSSTNFPVANAYQPTASPNQGGLYGTYGFLTEFSPDGSSLVYSTYFAGNTNVPYTCGTTQCWDYPYSAINGITVDGTGNAYVAGETNTYNFPTTAAYLTTNSTSQNAFVGFVSKFSSAGTLDYSTYFYESSGILTDIAAIAVDSSGSAYVTGSAFSDGTFPVTSTSICDPGIGGFSCGYGFVTKFDSTASNLLYSTFLGPNNSAAPRAITLDANKDAFVLASSTSNSFGIVNGIESYSNGTDLLLVEIDPLAKTELFATYLGGSADESPAGIVLDSNGYLYIAGFTNSSDFPVTFGASQEILGGKTDAFVLKVGPNSAPAVSVSPQSLQYSAQTIGTTSQPQTVLLRNMGNSSLATSSITTNGDFAESDNCGTSVPGAGNCTLSVTFTPTTIGTRTGAVVIRDDAAGAPHLINLSGLGLGSAAALSPTSLAFSAQPLGTSSPAQSVALTNTGNATLNVGSIQTTGDYTQTNNCPPQLLPGSSCNINVTFTPKGSGTRKGTLTVTDNASGTAQTANLGGAGVDFSLGGAPSSNTIKAGASAQYSVSVSALGGSFSNAVALSCSGLPALATCAFSPKTVTPGATGGSSQLTITTTASSAQMIPAAPSELQQIYAVWVQLPGLGLVGLVLTSSRKRSKRVFAFIVLALLLLGIVVMSGCAGGTGHGPQGTPTTYSVIVTGTSGNLQHSVPLTLTVQ